MSQNESSSQLPQDLILEIERVLAQHRIFVRKARNNAQKMLFFFGLCLKTENKDTNKIIDVYRNFAGAKIMDLTFRPDEHESDVNKIMDQLASREDADWLTSKEIVLAEYEQIDPWLDEIGPKHINLREKFIRYPLRADLSELFNCHKELSLWRQIVDIVPLLKDPWKETEKYDKDWNEAREKVEGFLAFVGESFLHRLVLKISSKTDRLWQAVQLMRNVPNGIKKHLAMLLTLVPALYVVLKIEAVNSLIRNMDVWAAIPFGLALLPLLVSKGFIWSQYARGHIVPSWDVGGIPHRSWRNLARAPDRFFQRWPIYPVEAGSGVPNLKALYQSVLDLIKRLFRAPKSILDVIIKGQIYRLGWYLLGWIIGALILFILVSVERVPSTYLTVFLIVIFLYTLILGARLIDFWDYLEPKPIRLHLLFYAAIGIYALLEDWGRWFFITVFVGWAMWFLWTFMRRPGRPLRFVLFLISTAIVAGLTLGGKTLRHSVWTEPDDEYHWRNDIVWPIPGNDPVVVMAASGGGSRAALYTALTLERLKEITVECRDNSSPECPLSDYNQAISSVSGGSLANAGYVARRLAGKLNLKNLKDAVSEDFILATLWGAFYPRTSRGDSIEKKWQGLNSLVRSCSKDGRAGKLNENTPIWGEEGVALGGICLSDVARLWRQAVADRAKKAPFPMPILNTATLDGHNVIITPLPKEYYTSADFGADLRNLKEKNLYGKYPSSRWVYYRDGIYGLEDLIGESFDPLLSSAVRASANFPFGFPLVELETKRPLFLHPNWTERCKDPDWEVCEQKTVYLTDGGALSNSGMWSLFRLLMNQADKGLNKRGVLLIIVDASKMDEPEDPDKTFLGLQSTISAQAPIGQYLHRTMFDLLAAKYGNGIAVTQIDLDPQKTNIHTTWAFDRGTRKELETIFDGRWSKKKAPLVEKWKYLYARSRSENPQAYEPPAGLELIDRDRPPMD